MGRNDRTLSSNSGYSLLFISDTEQSIIGSEPRQSKKTILSQDAWEYPESPISLTGFWLLAALSDFTLGLDQLSTELCCFIQELGVCETHGRQVHALWAEEYCQLVSVVIFRQRVRLRPSRQRLDRPWVQDLACQA